MTAQCGKVMRPTFQPQTHGVPLSGACHPASHRSPSHHLRTSIASQWFSKDCGNHTPGLRRRKAVGLTHLHSQVLQRSKPSLYILGADRSSSTAHRRDCRYCILQGLGQTSSHSFSCSSRRIPTLTHTNALISSRSMGLVCHHAWPDEDTRGSGPFTAEGRVPENTSRRRTRRCTGWVSPACELIVRRRNTMRKWDYMIVDSKGVAGGGIFKGKDRSERERRLRAAG